MTEEADTGVRCFAYARSLTPILLALVGLALIEAALVHLLVALLWSGRAALVLTAVSAAGVAWLVLLVRSFAAMPVLVQGSTVTMRAGRLRSIRFDRANVTVIGGEIGREALRDRAVLNLAMLAHPNVVVDLATPIAHGRRRIARVAHRLDDPAAFRATMDRERVDERNG